MNISLLLIGAIILLFATEYSIGKFDEFCGDLSYGVFLNHFFLQWAIVGVPSSWLGIVSYVGGSLFLSWGTQRFVERPVLNLRRRLRGN